MHLRKKRFFKIIKLSLLSFFVSFLFLNNIFADNTAKPQLNTFAKTPTDQAITITQAESTTPTQDTLNKFLQTAGSLTVGTDVTITFNANERKATLAWAPNSTKVQGNVEFTNVTVESSSDEEKRLEDNEHHRIPGAKGDKGDTGAQGPKGDTGAQGSAGQITQEQINTIKSEIKSELEKSNFNKTLFICLITFLVITLTALIGFLIHNSKKQK